MTYFVGLLGYFKVRQSATGVSPRAKKARFSPIANYILRLVNPLGLKGAENNQIENIQPNRQVLKLQGKKMGQNRITYWVRSSQSVIYKITAEI